MFDHLEFTVADIASARRFYGATTHALGGGEAFYDEGDKCAGFGTKEIVHLLLTAGAPTRPPMHICFRATSKEQVDQAHALALANGGTCNGPPGYRDHYAPGYYAAFMHDADGQNVEALFREPQSNP